MPDNPKVSIITAVYNGALYLEQTIQSVMAQTYQNIEYIVIDGGSTDGTVDILKKYDQAITHWISEKDKGIYDAWNKGLAKATGEWIAFLGADDILLPNAMELYAQELQGKDLEFISAKVEMVDEDLNHLLFYGRPWKWSSHKHQMKVSHVGALHHRSLFAKYGTFDASYKIAGDYEFLLRPREKLKTHFFPAVTAKMRAIGVSKTNNNVFKEVLRAKNETAQINLFTCVVEYYYQICKNMLVGKVREQLRALKR